VTNRKKEEEEKKRKKKKYENLKMSIHTSSPPFWVLRVFSHPETSIHISFSTFFSSRNIEGELE